MIVLIFLAFGMSTQVLTCHTQEGTAFFPGSSLAGNGLLVSDGPVWQRQRQLSNPAFRRSAIDSYAQVRLARLHTSLTISISITWIMSLSDAWAEQSASNQTCTHVSQLHAQAMGSATRQMLATGWAGSGRRDVYSDFNALTLQITTEALFGKNLPKGQGAKVTGVLLLYCDLSACEHDDTCCLTLRLLDEA